MKHGIAKAEKNKNPSLTINVKTRSPIEAFKMLRQGHPVDQMIGYYDVQGFPMDDVWMLDTTAKLHKLAEFRAMEKNLSHTAEGLEQELTNQKQIKDEEVKQQAAQSGQSGNTVQEVQKT